MERLPLDARPDWTRTVETQGFLFHEDDEKSLWNESAYYRLSEHDVEQLETATRELHRMCLEAAESLVKDGSLGIVGIPEPFHAMVAQSWARREPSLYGRFDLAYDGEGPPKLLEYNADTPTALLE